MSHLWLQIIITLIATLALSLVAGRYLAKVVTDQKTVLDRLIDPLDNLLYRLIGKQACSQAMNWKSLHAAHAGDQPGDGPAHLSWC